MTSEKLTVTVEEAGALLGMLKLIKEFVCFFLDTDSYSGRSDVKNPQLLDELSQIVSIKVKTT